MKYHQTQTRNEKLIIPAMVGSSISTGQANLTIAGNNNYKQLVGVMLLIFNAKGESYTGEAMVSVAATSGLVILPEQPYACIRPSFSEKPSDRIIPVDNIAGHGHDFRFTVSIPNKTIEQGDFNITAICFFTNR